MRRPGFGIKSVQNILNAIEESRKPRLEAFISALGIPMIGNTMSKEIVKHFKTYEEFRDAAKSHWDFTQIDKIAYEKASSIWNFNFSEADKVNEYIILYQEDVEETLGQNLINEKIAITGSLSLFKNRTVLQAAIESRGGKVVSGVSKNTTMLINNNPNSGSAKNITATKLGVPIITEQEFVKRYLEN